MPLRKRILVFRNREATKRFGHGQLPYRVGPEARWQHVLWFGPLVLIVRL